MASRFHVVIPEDLTKELSAIVAERGRSAFICDALREKLIREKQMRALEKLKKNPFKGGPKEWETDAAGWVRRLRSESEEVRTHRVKRRRRA